MEKQLEWDIQHQQEIELSDEEWKMVEEGLADYESVVLRILNARTEPAGDF